MQDMNRARNEIRDDLTKKTQQLKDEMLIWQKDQEQYQHQLHSEMLMLSDTRDNVARLND